jgi:hypothetical protein
MSKQSYATSLFLCLTNVLFAGLLLRRARTQ